MNELVENIKEKGACWKNMKHMFQFPPSHHQGWLANVDDDDEDVG